MALTNSKYKDIIGKHFDYTFDFDFLDVVADVLDRVDDFGDEEDIFGAIDSTIIYYDDQWKIIRFYQTPSEANWENAYDDFQSDIFAICEKIKESEAE